MILAGNEINLDTRDHKVSSDATARNPGDAVTAGFKVDGVAAYVVTDAQVSVYCSIIRLRSLSPATIQHAGVIDVTAPDAGNVTVAAINADSQN